MSKKRNRMILVALIVVLVLGGILGIKLLKKTTVMARTPIEVLHQYEWQDLSVENDAQAALKPYVQQTIRENASFLVIDTDQFEVDQAYLENYGINSFVKRFGRYSIYRNTKAYTNLYTITNYPQVNGSQGLCYTIEDLYGHFAIVDGGWEEQAQLLLELIVQYGGHVDAWIVTHPHRDHVEAFNNLIGGDFAIDVDQIYTIQMDKEKYAVDAPVSDGGFEYYLDFLDAIEGENVTYVKTGDEFDLFGLDMKVLNALDPYDDGFYTFSANNGSMMFKLNAKDTNILFCADVMDQMYDRLTSMYTAEDLHADYLQVSHHGWGLRSDFNTLVAPKVAFLDVNSSLKEREPFAAEVASQLEKEGVTTYNFDIYVRSFELK